MTEDAPSAAPDSVTLASVPARSSASEAHSVPASWLPLVIDTTVQLTATPQQLLDLAFDLDRYVASEPRLVAARWLGEPGPRAGARLVATFSIPFSVPLLRRLVPSTHAEVMLLTWEPPEYVVCRIRTAQTRGEVELVIGRSTGGDVEASVRGLLHIGPAIAGRLLKPLKAHLEALVANAIERGTRRADDAARTTG